MPDVLKFELYVDNTWFGHFDVSAGSVAISLIYNYLACIKLLTLVLKVIVLDAA